MSHLIWLFRTRKIRSRAKEDGKTFDSIAEECKEHGVEFAFAERDVRFWSGRSKRTEDIEVEGDMGELFFDEEI